VNERVDQQALVVGITGGVGSGKSSLAHALTATLGPTQTALLTHEAYYRHGAPARDGAMSNVLSGVDQALFLEHLRALRAGRPIRPPRDSAFTAHSAVDGGAVVAPRPIVVVEGLLLLWDPAARAILDLAIYLDAPELVRVERRLARSAAERGGATDAVLPQFSVAVRDVHRLYVEPTRTMADLVLSTAGRLEPLAEIAAAVILDRFARRRGELVRRVS
jgi:uridine kinase